MLRRFLISLLIALCAHTPSFAAPTKSPVTEVMFPGANGEVLENIRRHVRLSLRLNSVGPLSEAETSRLQKRVVMEVKQAVAPYGYYQAVVELAKSVKPNQLIYQVTLHEAVKVSSIKTNIIGSGENQAEFLAWRQSYPLQQGSVLLQDEYEQAKKGLLATALRLGYFDAEFSEHQIRINQARSLADINLTFVSGERYHISNIQFDWVLNEDTDAKARTLIDHELLNSLITLRTQQAYDADALVQTQQNLLNTPYFSRVSVQAGNANKETATVPIVITLKPRKRKAYSLEVGVGTDTGLRAGVGYENRRINRLGHNLSIRLGGSEIKRSAIFNYRIPSVDFADSSLNIFSVLEEELGNNRQFQQSQIGVELSRTWHESLVRFSLVASREKFSRTIDTINGRLESDISSNLLTPELHWKYINSKDSSSAKLGWSASATIRGASKSLASDIDFAQGIFETKFVFPVGYGRVKTRLKLAASLIGNQQVLPESLGFLTGGDDSVRGYKFESIGVSENGVTEVGNNLVVGSIEYQHPIRNDLAIASFFDVGDAFDSNADYQKGAGLGLRWRLPFGAARLDVASALDLEGDPLRLHFSFGTDL